MSYQEWIDRHGPDRHVFKINEIMEGEAPLEEKAAGLAEIAKKMYRGEDASIWLPRAISEGRFADALVLIESARPPVNEEEVENQPRSYDALHAALSALSGLHMDASLEHLTTIVEKDTPYEEKLPLLAEALEQAATHTPSLIFHGLLAKWIREDNLHAALSDLRNTLADAQTATDPSPQALRIFTAIENAVSQIYDQKVEQIKSDLADINASSEIWGKKCNRAAAVFKKVYPSDLGYFFQEAHKGNLKSVQRLLANKLAEEPDALPIQSTELYTAMIECFKNLEKERTRVDFQCVGHG